MHVSIGAAGYRDAHPDSTGEGCGLLFVSTSLRYPGPVAVWILVAGWAKEVRARYGASWIVTPDGTFTPERALELASRRRPPNAHGTRRIRVPAPVSTLKGDLFASLRALRFTSAARRGPWDRQRVRFVWQYHALFQHAGFVAAKRHGIPLVLFVDAPVVWEAERWGVKRPGWSAVLERVGEIPQLRSADLVACVSDEVADAVLRRGVSASRIVVAPCGVDAQRFTPDVKGHQLRQRLGIDDRFVVGWVGSFRKFHGVDLLLEAFAVLERQRPDAFLLLVGDGLDRSRLQQRAAEIGLSNIRFAGNVAYEEMPEVMAALDAGVVLDAGTSGFHYSPLKLREYMAAGRAVVAPRSGEIERSLVHNENSLLIPAGNPEALLQALISLHDRPTLRHRLGESARRHVLQHATWARTFATVEAALA